jgi:phosphohistidine phosphatase SixA
MAAQPELDPEPHRHHRMILVRPGEALGKRAWPGPPESRPMSVKGRKQVTRLARFLAAREVDVSAIVCGREARERETAEVLGLWLERRVLVDPRIAEGLGLPELGRVLDDAALTDLRPPRRQRILVVAREPLASMLLVLLTDSPGIDLAAGGAASLRLHGEPAPGAASLGWLVVPSMLRGIKTKGGPGRRSPKASGERERELVAV